MQLILYHGTNTKYVENILKEGLKSPTGYYSVGWYMLASDFESALYHATTKEGGFAYVFEFKINTSPGNYWIGFPYLWPGQKLSDKRIWFALREPIPTKFIKKIHKITYEKYVEQKLKGL